MLLVAAMEPRYGPGRCDRVFWRDHASAVHYGQVVGTHPCSHEPKGHLTRFVIFGSFVAAQPDARMLKCYRGWRIRLLPTNWLRSQPWPLTTLA